MAKPSDKRPPADDYMNSIGMAVELGVMTEAEARALCGGRLPWEREADDGAGSTKDSDRS